VAANDFKRLIVRDLMRPWTSESFRGGAVPTGAYLAWGSSGFVEDVVRSFPEFEEDASRMKWDSTAYVFAGTIFTRPAFMDSRFGAGIITARAGDGDLRQEWNFEPTVDDPLAAYYSLERGSTFGPLGHHTNELAAEAIRLLGVTRVIPIHYGTFPLLTGTPDALKQETADISSLAITVIKQGESVRQGDLA